MDATLQASLVTNLTTWKTGAVDMIVAVAPLAIGFVIIVSLFFLGVKLFRAIAHV